MNRREASKGLAASLVALTAMSDRAQGMEPMAAEKYRQEKVVARQKATALAYEFLKKVGRFSTEDCDAARKAIMKKQEVKEAEYRGKFSHAISFHLFYTPYLIRLPMYWQAVRLCFLLDEDGFDLLQVPISERGDMMALGDKMVELQKCSPNRPRVVLPDITIHGEKMRR